MPPAVNHLNVFGIFAELQKTPFAVSRQNWTDHDYVVITKIIPKGNYGTAFGFPVRDRKPNDHFKGYREWEANMSVPNAGVYQWRVIDVSALELQKLIVIFQAKIAPQFEFGSQSL